MGILGVYRRGSHLVIFQQKPWSTSTCAPSFICCVDGGFSVWLRWTTFDCWMLQKSGDDQRYRGSSAAPSQHRLSLLSSFHTTESYVALPSAGLTMWQMWQMPRASGQRGASGSREIFFQPVSSQVIWHNFCNKKIKMSRIDSRRNNCHHVSTGVAGCDRSLSRVSKGARANNCHGRLALIRHWPSHALVITTTTSV